MEQNISLLLNQCDKLHDFEKTNTLIFLAQQGCTESLDELVKGNFKLVYALTKRFKGKERIQEDLFQIGNIGLLKAINRFDLSRGLRFSTYAVPIILGEIRKFLRDDGILKVSRTIKDNARKLNVLYEEYWEKFQKEPTLDELVHISCMSKEEVHLATEFIREPLSLSHEISPDIKVEDRLADKSDPYDKWMSTVILREAFDQLTEKEKIVVSMRYFEDRTQNEIGVQLGVSQAHISIIEKTALRKLKAII